MDDGDVMLVVETWDDLTIELKVAWKVWNEASSQDQQAIRRYMREKLRREHLRRNRESNRSHLPLFVGENI